MLTGHPSPEWSNRGSSRGLEGQRPGPLGDPAPITPPHRVGNSIEQLETQGAARTEKPGEHQQLQGPAAAQTAATQPDPGIRHGAVTRLDLTVRILQTCAPEMICDVTPVEHVSAGSRREKTLVSHVCRAVFLPLTTSWETPASTPTLATIPSPSDHQKTRRKKLVALSSLVVIYINSLT